MYPRKRRVSPALSSVESVEETRISMYPAKVLVRAACYQPIGVSLRVAGYHCYSDVGRVLLLYYVTDRHFEFCRSRRRASGMLQAGSRDLKY